MLKIVGDLDESDEMHDPDAGHLSRGTSNAPQQVLASSEQEKGFICDQRVCWDQGSQ